MQYISGVEERESGSERKRAKCFYLVCLPVCVFFFFFICSYYNCFYSGSSMALPGTDFEEIVVFGS